MNEKLKPCPFCGSANVERVISSADLDYPIDKFISCQECGCRTEMQQDMIEAIKAWNTRKDFEAGQQSERARITKGLDEEIEERRNHSKQLDKKSFAVQQLLYETHGLKKAKKIINEGK